MIAEDSLVLAVISLLVLLYIIMVVRRVRQETPLHNYQVKRTKPLIDNKVRYGPSEEEIDQIVKILDVAGQSYSAEDLDRLVYDKDSTWVMYAYGSAKRADVEGVMIAEKVSNRMRVIAYAVDTAVKAADKDFITQRLVNGIAWEGVQSRATAMPSFDANLSDSKPKLVKMFKAAYLQYRDSRIEPPLA